MHIHEFRASDRDAAASAMAGAFAADPLYRYFIADEEARLAFLSGFMRFRLRYGVRRGTVFVTDDQKGVAVWLPPGTEMGPLDVLRNGGIGPMLRCTREERARIMNFNTFADRLVEEHATVPAWRLSPICVAADAQGQGHGRALLEHGLNHLGGPFALETQSDRNVSFYEAAGFSVRTAVPIPDAPLTHYVMTR